MKRIIGWILLIIALLLSLPVGLGFLLGTIGGWTTDAIIDTPAEQVEHVLARISGLVALIGVIALGYGSVQLIRNKDASKTYISFGITAVCVFLIITITLIAIF